MKLLFTLSVALALALARAAAAVDYARDVLPILSDKCYHCHGPDETGRKAKLRLDTREGTLRTTAPIVIPGKSHESELIGRITTTNLDDVMPPTDSNRSLTPKQIATLKQWVDEGAKWGQHWAFVPPVRPAVPAVGKKVISKTVISAVGGRRTDSLMTDLLITNPLDAFILARLEKEKLAPAAEATRETWLRRVSFDLTGLPPTLPELDAFLADASTNAHERVVDRLLASPRFGERMASEWLDLARFADTHGYQMDRFRPVWPYRDWVIKAFNQNLPFDQFVTWQLAGDLLPNATKEQRLATTFNRLHNQNEEGGIAEEEYRVAYVVDRVNTFSTAFLGLTTECTRCHDHKYDPITQKDFYSLFAFFQNVDESGQTSYFTDSTPVPSLLLSTEAQDQKLDELQRTITAKESALAALRETARSEFEKNPPPAPGAEISGLIAHFSFNEMISNKVASLAGTNFARAQEKPLLVPGPDGQAVELSGENGFTFGTIGHFNRASAFTLSLRLQTPTNAPRFVVLHHSRAPIDAGSRGYELLLEHGRVAFGLHHMWPGNSLKVVSQAALITNQWTHVAVTYDGSSRAGGVRFFIDGVAGEVEVVRDNLWKDITYGGEPELTLGNRFRDNGFKGGRVDDLRVFDRALTAVEVAQVAGLVGKPSSREDQFEHFFATEFAPARAAEKELQATRHEQRKFINPIPEIMAMQELPQPKPAFLLQRGAYDSPGERVFANTPGVLPPFPAGQPTNRLGLARWLLEPNHPLMARVTVNRFWQMMFGQGLVETSDNFGSQGAQPTHPELLDWLALEFSGPSASRREVTPDKSLAASIPDAPARRVARDTRAWDVKHLLKLIALSQTYRQSSQGSAELLARDPANQLLARGPARRLTAEMLRDQSLALSGLLVDKIGGPSVKPYQPAGLWEIAMGKPNYDQGRGDDLHRRSLYTYWKRTVPPPTMMAFDAADRSYCSVQRQSTSTPLQALALLNDVQITEAARHLSQRMLLEGGGSDEARVTWMFQAATNRKPSPLEIPVLKQLLAEQRATFSADTNSAAQLLKVGEAKNNPTLDSVELAAGTVLAQALLNHDGALMRR